MTRQDFPLKRIVIHALRACLFAGVIVLIHLQHERFAARERAKTTALDVSVEQLQEFFPTAIGLSETAAQAGTRDVVDADGQRLGYVLQTMPECADIVGFSGPTNVLVAFDSEDRIRGIAVLSSGDTREHVAQVRQDVQFMQAFDGLTWEEAALLNDIDGVSGATLTSLAMAESVVRRLGGDRPTQGSLRFPDPPSLETVRVLFPNADRVEPDERLASLWHVRSSEGKQLGALLRSSPAADDIVGYQGPTEALLGLDATGKIIGLAIGRSYDNEPYVSYVREEPYFLEFFNGQTLGQLAEIDLQAVGVEGVSGATMTSMSVARGIRLAAGEHLKAIAEQQRRAALAAQPKPAWRPSPRDVGTAAMIVAGLVIGMTPLKGRVWIRVPFLLLLIGYLGLVNGDLLSQAMLVGWAQSGVPFQSAAGLALLTFAAFSVPLVTKSNVYCTHLCPHGAAQQLLRNRLPRRWCVSPRHLPKWLRRGMALLPGLLLGWVVVVAMLGLGFSLVDIEPFDAYVFHIAGWATLTIAVVGLVASLFVPMAYCRFGCPTGALLGWLRYNRRSDRLGRRDVVAAACLMLAVALYLWA